MKKSPADGLSSAVYHSASFDILRFELPEWDTLSRENQEYLFHLSEACLWGRDIIYLQNHHRGLALRELLEAVWSVKSNQTSALEEYLAQYWFHSGLYHSYEETKVLPKFSQRWFSEALDALPYDADGFLESLGTNRETILRWMFDPDTEGVRRASGDPETLVERSAVNFYGEGVTTMEARSFYNSQEGRFSIAPGLNSRLIKDRQGALREETASVDGLFGPALEQIVYHLNRALPHAPSDGSREVLRLLIQYYETGDLERFADYSRKWVHVQDRVDMINGFIETYTDPLGLKGSWEGLLQVENPSGTERTSKIIALAGDLERVSPIDEAFKREKIGAVSNRAIDVVVLAGDSYPASPLGINLPNDERIRAEEGSKSVTLNNISEAVSRHRSDKSIPVYFYGEEVQKRQELYGALADTLHTDLHEGIGHASGRLADGVTGDALREFDSVIEETRADLNALYFISDPLLRQSGIVETDEVSKALYDGYLTRGLLSQLARIGEKPVFTQAHMQNRALIGWWTLDLARENRAVCLDVRDGKHYLFINDYDEVRRLFGEELREIQRIKSTGDYEKAKELIEKYAVNVDETLLAEIRERDKETGLPPFTGFVNPLLSRDKEGHISLTADEGYFEQNLRYSREYRSLVPALADFPKRDIVGDEEIEAQLRHIRNQLRRLMDVKTAQKLKENGYPFRTIFGSNTLKLKELSATLPQDEALSRRLWREDVREMRLLSLFLLTPYRLPKARLLALAREVRTTEEAEQLCNEVLLRSELSEEILSDLGTKRVEPFEENIRYALASGSLRQGKGLPDAFLRSLGSTAARDFVHGDTALRMLLHRLFVKLAEHSDRGREAVRDFISEMEAQDREEPSVRAVTEDLTELLAFLEQ